MPFLHFEYHVDLKKMSNIIAQVRNLTNRGRSLEPSEGRPTFTRMSRRHLSIETLNAYRIDYEFDVDPNYILIRRWVPEYEQDFLWAHTKEIRERRHVPVLAIEEKAHRHAEFETVRRLRPRRAFRHQLIAEAKERVKAAARFLRGGGASDYSDADSDYNFSDRSSQTSDESSTFENETHREIKKILFGSERLATALQELKDKVKGRAEENESSKKLEQQQKGIANEGSERPADDHSLAGSTSDARIGLHRAMTDLKENIDSRSKKNQTDKKERAININKPRIGTSTGATTSQPTTGHQGEIEGPLAHHESSTPTPFSAMQPSYNLSQPSSGTVSLKSTKRRPQPLITFLDGSKEGVSVEDNSRSSLLLAEHSKPVSGLPICEDSSSNPIHVPLGRRLTTKSETLATDSGASKVQIEAEAPDETKASNKEGNPQQTNVPPVRKTADLLNENLVKGYLFPKVGELPFLQPRRTLDQYFYTHLENTSRRDGDQVVYRYTKRRNMSPKMFMVDQLWLWILNEGK